MEGGIGEAAGWRMTCPQRMGRYSHIETWSDPVVLSSSSGVVSAQGTTLGAATAPAPAPTRAPTSRAGINSAETPRAPTSARLTTGIRGFKRGRAAVVSALAEWDESNLSIQRVYNNPKPVLDGSRQGGR